MTNFEFDINERSTIFEIANKYDFMKYYEYSEIDCFCISIFETSALTIMRFLNELNTNTNSTFVIHFENLLAQDNDKLTLDEYQYITVSTVKIFNAFHEYAKQA